MTNTDWAIQILTDAYDAMDVDNGSNDAEHEALWAAVEFIEEILKQQGITAPRPDDR